MGTDAGRGAHTDRHRFGFGKDVSRMDRTAQVEHEVHDLIRRRWSPLAFASRTVDPEVLRSLFEAARWAPSSYNEQPWSFLAATRDQPRLFEQMVDCLIDANARWARNAPVLAISVAKLRFDRDGSPNRHAFHDVGLAVENLVIQATAWGLCVHQMGGFRPDRAREVFRIPEDHEPVAAMAIG